MTNEKECAIRDDSIFSKLLLTVFVGFIALAPATTIGYFQYHHHFGNSKVEIKAEHTDPVKAPAKH